MAESLYEPDPRHCPYSAVINGELHVWGGKAVDTTSLQVYHLCLESWRQLDTRGPPPPRLYNGASAHSDNYLYVYGGVKDDHSYSGCLHRLDTKTSSWTQLAAYSANAPMKKAGCGIIAYENSVIVIGGFGIRNGPIQPGSEWRNWRDTLGWTNEMNKYDLREGKEKITRYVHIRSYKDQNIVLNCGRMDYPNFYEVVKKLRGQFSGGRSTLIVDRLFTL